MKKIILTVAVAALAIMAVASSASAGVARFQVATGLKVTGTFHGTSYVHTYKLASSCTGSFTGTGGMPELGLKETISGSLNGSGNVVIDSTYETYNTPFSFHYNGPLAGGGTYTDSLGQAVTVTAEVTTSNYKSHADYLAQGGTADAAQACIGTAKSGPADSVLGSIVYNNDSFGSASFSFAGQDGGNGTAFYADKAGFYSATATDVEVIDATTASMSLKVTSSKHPSVPVGTEFTVTLHDVPGAPDFFTINNQGGKQFVSKLGNIFVNYR